ncbi:MAG: lytic transglycosylase domain-containing protein [Myxococcales bacterium]|jgi:soluble lytic murein transglycosylase-like protein|nr:lytic transglycosylase domain-containing protein [Myxococcales bacterium]
MAKSRTKSRARKRRSSKWRLLALLLAVAIAPLLLLNGTVALVGQTPIPPLSPRFLKEKWTALGAFARHLPNCLLRGHAKELDAIVAHAEARHHLPPGLLAALVHVESGSRVHRISRAGAMGPGQLMPTTAQLMGVRDPFDPEQAIDGSARYLARQLARFKDLPLALAAYNAGPGNVSSAGGGGRIPLNGETERYVPKVLAEYERRAALLAKIRTPPRPDHPGNPGVP